MTLSRLGVRSQPCYGKIDGDSTLNAFSNGTRAGAQGHIDILPAVNDGDSGITDPRWQVPV